MIPGSSRDVDTRVRVTTGSDRTRNALKINWLFSAGCHVFMLVNKEIPVFFFVKLCFSVLKS